MDFTSLEAEQSVLGSLLAEPKVYDDIADLFDPDLFSVASHRAIASTMVELIRDRVPYDSVSLLTKLQQKGLVPSVVPHDLPMRIEGAVGSPSSARYYVETLRSLWARRQVRAIALDALNDVRDVPGEVFADEVIRKLALIETKRGRAIRPLGDACRDLMEQFERTYKGETISVPSWPTGFARLDGLTGGIAAGYLTVIGARPSVGKTALMCALADNLAAHGVPVGIFELEDEERTLARRAIARRSKIATTLLRGAGAALREDHWSRLTDPSLWHTFEHYPIFVDDTHGLNATEVCARMRRWTREKGIRVWFLDHLLELRFPGRKDARRDVEIGESLALIRDTAKELQTGIVIMHQLNRDLERRANPTPTLADLKDSGDIEAKARLVIFLTRNQADFILDVAKNSDGPKGQVVLNWLEDSMGIEDRRSA